MGYIVFMAGMMLAGLVANSGWYEHMTVAQVLPQLEGYFIVRAVGGGIVVVSAFLFAINIIVTFLSKPLVHREHLETTEGEKDNE